MFQYAAGRALALRSNCELVLLPNPHDHVVSHSVYRMRCFHVTGRELPIANLNPAVLPRYQRVLRRILPDFLLSKPAKNLFKEKFVFAFEEASKAGQLTETKELLFEPALLAVQRNIRLSGYWQNERYFADIAPLIRQEFQIVDVLDEKSQACLEMIQRGPSAFMHVRRGDYLDENNVERFGLCSENYYCEGAAMLRQKYGDHLRFFVFSNDTGWVRERGIGGPDAVVVDWNESAPQNDLMLMRACQHAVIANSSFGWWGAWLGEWPGQTVIAPRIWFKSVPEYQDIIPDRWVVL